MCLQRDSGEPTLDGGVLVVVEEDYIKFITNSDEKLETSSLLRQILIAYINTSGKDNVEPSIDKLFLICSFNSFEISIFISFTS